MKYFLVFCLMFTLISAFSQEEQKSSLNMEGQITATTNGKDLFFNLGGPTLKFNYPKFAFAWTFMPSFRFHDVKGSIQVAPILGTGLQVYSLKDKRFIVSLPFYYLASNNTWIGTIGVGYVLSKPKK